MRLYPRGPHLIHSRAMRRLILAAVLLSGGCGLTAPTATNTSPPTPVIDTGRAQNGEKIYKKLVEGLKRAEPQLSGFAAPSVRLTVPKSKWGKLSKPEQVDVTYYAASLVADVRANPRRYVDLPVSAPAYENAVSYAGRICEDCWEIMVGQPTKDKVLSVDTTVVQGDSPWITSDPCCRGRNSSAFRSIP
jgi:hypothetical protein